MVKEQESEVSGSEVSGSEVSGSEVSGSEVSGSEVSIESLKHSLGISTRVSATAYSPDLGRQYPSNKTYLKAKQLTKDCRIAAFFIGQMVNKQNQTTVNAFVLDFYLASNIELVQKNITAIQAIFIRTAPGHRIWMSDNHPKHEVSFTKGERKPNGYKGPRLPEKLG